MNTYEKGGRGLPVIVNQESVKDSCPEKHRDEGSLLNANKHFYPERPSGVKDLSAWHSHSWLCSCRITGHGARNTRTPRIMCPPLQESTPCTIASSAAPDGMSVKLVTACGDSPAGPALTTPNRSTPCRAPSISAPISLTPHGPTAKGAARRFSEKFSAPTPARDFTSPRKFRPRT